MKLEQMPNRAEASRCLLCDNAPCARACPRGADPARVLRALYFESSGGAAARVGAENPCNPCSAPCESACPIALPIRRILSGLSPGPEAPAGPLPSLNTAFCGISLENPFLLSSSVVASGYDMLARAFRMGWAGAAYKTICDFIPREASPRYAALGNPFYGFKNIEQLSRNRLDEDLDILRRLKRDFPAKVLIASIMGRGEAEWAKLARRCAEAGADLLELNFSCPNMEEGGLGCDVGQSAELVRRYTRAVKGAVTIPVLAKLTPNVGDMVPIALAAREGGADGLAAINTVKSLMGMNLDTYASQPSVRGLSGVGGYSGKAIKPIALRFIWELAACGELKGLPISGMGGIETWRDAAEFLLLGASNVQITTSVMQYGYRIIDDLTEGLARYLQEKGLTRVSDLVGLAVDNVKSLDLLERHSIRYPKFERSRCLGCSRCALSCADGGHAALSMGERGPILNARACVGCHLCIAVCPVGAATAGKRREIEEETE